jgi:hypothetical protein
MNHVDLRKTPTGYDGNGTLNLGRSSVTFSGHLDRQEIERLRGALQMAERWVNAAGAIDTGAPDFMASLTQGLGVASDIAKSPIGDAVQLYGGGYGILAVEAAKGAGPALKTLQGYLGPAAGTVARMHSGDPKVQAKTRAQITQLLKDAGKGKPDAVRDRLELCNALLKHKDAVIQEQKDRLAMLGDPMGYADTGAPPALVPAFGQGMARRVTPPSQAQLVAHLDDALTRTRLFPQPTFMRRR